jgi:hypothetical protein
MEVIQKNITLESKRDLQTYEILMQILSTGLAEE